MATTTNYGWTTPDDTALVKDGASAIRTLGSSVDTTTKNLNPETTLGDLSFRSSTSNVNTRIPIGSSGQHLTVVAGVPAWATASDQTPLTTKGDLFTFSTVDARLGVGTNTYVLTADSAEATGLKWAAPASSSFAGARLTKSIGQTISNNTDTMVSWDVETFDVGGYHDNATNNTRITIPSGKAGYYQIDVTLDYAANATGQRVITLAKNGTNRAYNLNIIRPSGAGGYTSVFYSDVVYGAVADYFEISTFQDSGGNVNLIGNNGDPGACYFSFSLIGA